jgi:hypothetical protein
MLLREAPSSFARKGCLRGTFRRLLGCQKIPRTCCDGREGLEVVCQREDEGDEVVALEEEGCHLLLPGVLLDLHTTLTHGAARLEVVVVEEGGW